jgi:predicted site-specific integrase-resolvase
MPDPHEPPNEDDPDMEELTLSEVAQEFRINRGTIGNWVNKGKLSISSTHFSELGVKYYKVRRGDVSKLLQEKAQNKLKGGRPLKRT